ncbi:exodeoxyribonuclease I [Halioxenophilus aromaticivorans]|uniref:Exodeoxyribonuclease I n=1 Tax=Halioxenophilus aromaticivorans TaxID=1306992 RepID=A0AAV3TYR9_9ALTE
MTSLFWHDYETWGASPALDRPVQFAGVRTNLDLEIIDDPVNIMCRPSDDFIPHPEACLITGLTPQQALSEGLPERDFIAKVYEQLAEPGTCGVGYNSIRFDDEVTRYSLWRNFYDPYEREYKNGNSRWDIIDMVRLTYALRPEGIEWPMVDGVPSFKLENIAAANHFEHENAHDALSDVYATIALAKRIKTLQPKLFDYLFTLRDKREAASHIDIGNSTPLVHVSAMFPASRGCTALVVPLANHPTNKNSIICFDLSADPTPLFQLSAEQIQEKLYTKTEDLPEDEERLALKEVHLNKSPVLATAKLLTPEHASRLQIDLDLCRQHWKQIHRHNLGPKLQQVYASREFAKPREEEAALYDGFVSAKDKQKMAQVRTSNGEDLAAAALSFDDPRLNPLLFRYRARNFPETLTEAEHHQWQEYRYQRLTEPRPGLVTLEELHEKIFSLQESEQLTPAQMQVLDSLSEYADAVV